MPLLGLGGLGALAIVTVSWLTIDRITAFADDERRSAVTALEASTRVAEEKFASMLRSVRIVLDITAAQVEAEMANPPPPWEQVADTLAMIHGRQDILAMLAVADRNGSTTLISPEGSTHALNIADRAHFQAAHDDPTLGFHVGRHIVSRFTGKITIPAVRRVNNARGDFRGVIVGTLKPDIVLASFNALPAGSEATIALVEDTGAVLAHWPTLPDRLGQTSGEVLEALQAHRDDKSVAFRMDQSPMGGAGLAVFRRIADAPMVVVASMPEQAIDGAIDARRRQSVAVAAGISLVILAIVGGLGVMVVRGERMRQRLALSEMRFRNFSRMASDWYWETGPDLRITRLDENAEGVLPGSANQALGKRRDELIDHAVPRDALARHLDDLAAHRPFRGFVFKSIIGNGRFIRVSGEPIFSSAGDFLGYHGTASDVSALVKAQELLERSIEALKVGVAIFDEHDRLIIANDIFFAGTDVVGVTGPGATFSQIARHFADHIIDPAVMPDGAEAWWAWRREHHAGFDLPFDEVDREGRHWRIHEGRIADGGSIIIRTDLTKEKRREASLAKLVRRNDMLAAAIEATTSGILISDPNQAGNPAVFANSAFCRQLGYRYDEIIGRSPRIFRVEECDQATLDKINGALDQHQSAAVQVPGLHKDGHRIMLDLRVSPVFGRNGNLLYFIGTQNDITDRVDAEARLATREAQLSALASHLPGVVYQRLRAPNGRLSYTFLSPAIEQLTGYSAAACMADPSLVMATVQPGWRDKLAATVEESVRSLSRYELKFPITAPGGQERWVHTISTPRRLPDGTIVWDGLSLDITEEHHQAEQRLQLEFQIRHLQKLESIGTLAAGIAHDLNNALVPIIALTQAGKKRTQPGGWEHGNLVRILEAAERCRDLVKSIVAFSRKGGVEVKELDLSETVRSAVRMLRSTVPSTIRVIDRIDDLGGLIRGDQSELQQILINLTTNSAHAIDGRPDGSIGIRVSAAAGDDLPPEHKGQFVAKRVAVLSVEDNGSGMDEATIGRIFDPFFTTKSVGQGTGLGLAIVHRIVSGMGGTIAVNSTVGKGTRFDLYFPLGPVRGEPAMAEARPGQQNLHPLPTSVTA
jgi:PAS domain S-box-containing protein